MKWYSIVEKCLVYVSLNSNNKKSPGTKRNIAVVVMIISIIISPVRPWQILMLMDNWRIDKIDWVDSGRLVDIFLLKEVGKRIIKRTKRLITVT